MALSIPYKQKRALIIGINNYPREPLKYCINDAADLKIALEDIDFKVSYIVDCNRDKFYHKIDSFADKIQSDDLVLFYFAGHGKQNENENYLLPSNYNYDYRGHERDYIGERAINVKYIMNQLDHRNARVTIYLFDCCRNLVRIRGTDANQGLLPATAASQSLIVYACAPGKAALDETQNNKNGIFMGNLLKYIKMSNKDIEEITEMVTNDVCSQTGGFQRPHRINSLTGKVFLVTNNDAGSSLNHQSTRSNFTPYKLLPPIEKRLASASKKQKPTNQAQPISLQSISRRQTEKVIGTVNRQHPYPVHNCGRSSNTPRFDRLSTLSSKQMNKTISLEIACSPTIPRCESRYNQQHFHDSDTSLISEHLEDSDNDDDKLEIDDTSFPIIPCNSKSDLNHEQTVHDEFQNNSGVSLEERSSSSSSSIPFEIVDEISVPELSTNSPNTLAVRIRSFCRSQSLIISIDTTMQNLINIIWNEMKFDMERYRKDSHVLLLFNHRLHIFIDSDVNALVKDFISLSPSSHLPINDLTDFYVYGLPLARAHSMYNFDKDCSSLFGNPNLWYPVYFTDYKQLERPQSIFLSSLYALRLYFRPENQELLAQQVAMEAQFFLQLRKYLFPPAILALKHAVAGSMFWFEKPLLMDGLIQLLTRLCNPETTFREEICDFIPLLFCWLLEKCDPTEEQADHFPEVKLINAQTGTRSYFQNPVTTSANKRKVLLLEEFDETHDYDAIQHHFDIRSLILYLTSVTNTSLSSPCECDSYIIYDPIIQDPSFLESVEYWSESVIRELYTTMAQTREYHSFSIVTRGLVTADIKNQLVLLQENRTVALLFSEKKVMRSDAQTRQDVDHFFQIFDPLKCTKEMSYIRAELDTFLDERQAEPRLPAYINDSMNITTANINSFIHNEPTGPAHQVTVILLDRSRSMSDYRITSCDKTKNLTHINICEIMVGRLSDNVLATSEIHALGRIEFATNYKTVCPITRSREEFEKALNYYNGNKEQTCMNDAIDEAIRQIKTFTDSPRRARRDCKKLIICLSDGINNYGDTTTKKLHDSARKNKIVIDFISFIRDDQLKTEKEVLQARQMRKLCTDSGGYVYRNIQLLSDIELAAIFEQEAAVWLSKRCRTSRGAVDKPERYVPPIFKEVAVHQLPSSNNVQNSSQSRRIFNELHTLLSDPLENITIFAVPSNIAFWKVILKGPAETPYEGKFWMLFVEFDSNYPKCSPNVRFVTPIYHVNISGDGKICHQIFDRGWSQQTKMCTVFKNILDLLDKPNFIDAMSLEMAHLYNNNNDEYKKQAEIHSKKYAKTDIETLKREYRLEEDHYQ